MSQLVIVHDSFSGQRETVDLYCGESLASNFRRLWPRGIQGPWRVFRDAPHLDNEIAATDMPGVVVAPFQVYVLVRGVAGAATPFLINLAISIALSALARAIAPKPRRGTNDPDMDSPNNQLAGQRNQLRVGGRIPEILGKVRSYPDLLCFPAETWQARHQSIIQWFVVGVGDYDVSDARLGDTPIAANPLNSAIAFHPGDPVGDILIVKESPEVSGISLDTQETAPPPTSGVTWTAPGTLSYPTYLAMTVGGFISVSGTLNNNKIFTVVAVPPSTQTAPPFIYTLGPPAVVNESGGGAAVTTLNQIRDQQCFGKGPLNVWGSDRIQLSGIGAGPLVGNVLDLDTTTHGGTVRWVGTVTSVTMTTIPPIGGGLPTSYWTIQMTDLNGAAIIFNNPGNASPTTFKALMDIKEYTQTGASAGGGGTSTVEHGEPTPWFTVPHDNPEQVWVDIEFPQGLVAFVQGFRKNYSVEYRIDLRRSGAPGTVQSRTITRTAATSGPLRWTEQLYMNTFTLTGPGRLECRVQRTSPIDVNTTSPQITYIGETFWKRLAGVVRQVQRPYPDVTIMGLSLTNDRSATSLGETSFNVLVTRRLPTWDGSAMTTTAAATEKWADSFVSRVHNADGANKPYSEIDLAGIYALQAQLDLLDGGDLGKISMTLDQMQDIDSELSQVADVVRALVYRVGKKIFVTRDQSTATRLALFNGRTKNTSGESVSLAMTNDGENDGVTVTWVDQAHEFKRREYTYTTKSLCVNPARIGTLNANWAQAFRRARYEWNRIRYRREQLVVSVTEDGRICRPGDVVNITDDIANLAATAGEILVVSGLSITLDRDVTFEAGHTYSLLVRDLHGQAIDIIPVTAGLDLNMVTLARAPIAGVDIKGRDASTGTLYAFYDDAAAIVRPWLLTGTSASGPFVELHGFNYTDLVYQGDTVPLDPVPPITPVVLDEIGEPNE